MLRRRPAGPPRQTRFPTRSIGVGAERAIAARIFLSGPIRVMLRTPSCPAGSRAPLHRHPSRPHLLLGLFGAPETMAKCAFPIPAVARNLR